jgi:hypothetical protein
VSFGRRETEFCAPLRAVRVHENRRSGAAGARPGSPTARDREREERRLSDDRRAAASRGIRRAFADARCYWSDALDWRFDHAFDAVEPHVPGRAMADAHLIFLDRRFPPGCVSTAAATCRVRGAGRCRAGGADVLKCITCRGGPRPDAASKVGGTRCRFATGTGRRRGVWFGRAVTSRWADAVTSQQGCCRRGARG